ncbi:MAG: M14 family zinc carboxypeptidase [Blastocatellia bacterium]|nr:M14 family zinc carboxypeptidase [Blastocatellia bacterium]MCS7157885.1 M14 family zinc carboxypeptidase [Blastocatellia bacterium]MDW8168037.1 M14 family metallopeptidase [Acidobacteriota bacterium]MDW8257714.1 M14 family metallopeptidase [Acidobacteriota bacterium]
MRRLHVLFVIVGLVLGTIVVPAQEVVPSPASILGFQPGEDRQVADWTQITDYFRRLDEASARVRVLEIGRSTQNRPILMAVITSPENMAHLDRYREIARRLADPRTIADEAEAERLIAEGRVIVAITCSIHSTEIVGSQMAMELAYRLASDASPETREILDRTIVLLFPSANPDGIDIVASWYRRTLGTPYEGTAPPELYHPYTGHDNNRDWFMLTQVETQAITRALYREWFPQILYDVHQMGSTGARMFVPPFYDPPNPNIDPILLRSVAVIGYHMAWALTAAGFRGVVTSAQYDTWWAGGLRTMPYYHNMVGILTEAASARLMTPITLTREQLRGATRGLSNPLERTTNFPDPWPGGVWRPMDILQMELVAARALLQVAARYREEFLRNFYQLGKRAIERGRTEEPFAYIIPPDQWDPPTAAHMVNVLMAQGVEVHRATERFMADGVEYPAGSFVLLLAQPLRALVKTLLEIQRYPERRLYPGGPPERPYDVAGWTLPLQMGVRVVEVARPFEARLQKVTEAVSLIGRVSEPRDLSPRRTQEVVWLLEPKANRAFSAVNELLTSGLFRVSRLPRPMTIEGQSYPAGTFVLRVADGARPSGPTTRQTLEEIARRHGVEIRAVTQRVSELVPLEQRRVGLYRSWVPSMDEGWTRWVLEQFGFSYTTLRDRDIRAGDLRARFDVIILPSDSPREIRDGHRPGSYPPEYTGGIGKEGVEQLKAFVQNGGVLLALGESSDLLIEEFGLPVRNVLRGLSPNEYFCPGSILRVTMNPDHPVAYGLPVETDVYVVGGFAFEVSGNAENASAPEIVARYAEDPLRSGYLLGREKIAGRAALLDVPYGHGRVILVGFRPQHRGQSWGTFKVLFNALLLGPRSSEKR